MKLLLLSNTDYSPEKNQSLEEHGVYVINMQPCLMSILTIMKLKKTVEKKDIDIVETDSIHNTMSAVSARKISKKNFKIIHRVDANTKIPKTVPDELKKEVDLWLFESNRLLLSYPGDLKKKVIGKTGKISKEIDKLKNPKPCKNVLWIGDIEKAESLKEIIDAINETEKEINIRICGTGKASLVMPLVRHHRYLPNKDRITWLGEKFFVNKEIENADTIILSKDDPNNYETIAALVGKNITNTEEFKKYTQTEQTSPTTVPTDTIEFTDYIDRLSKIYEETK